MPTHSETTAFLRDQRGLPHNKLTVSGFGSAVMKFSRKLQLHCFSSRLVSTAVVSTGYAVGSRSAIRRVRDAQSWIAASKVASSIPVRMAVATIS